VKTPSLEQPIRFLSGGNQQKAIIGRAMNTTPRILIFDEPTKGIDVGAKVEIYRIMKTLAEQRGVGIILVSSDLTELLRCSNRVITIYEGRKTGEFDVETTASTAIMDAMFGESNQLNGKQVKAN
jgi:ribose transport system ATP-binding protein